MANSTITLKLPKTFTQEKFNEYISIIHLSSGYIVRIPDYFEILDGDSYEGLLFFNFSFIEKPTYKSAVLRYPINASTNLYELNENDIYVESNINVQITDDSVVLSYTFPEGTDLSNIIYDMNETDAKSIFGDDFFRVGDSPTPQKSEKFLNNSGLSYYDAMIKNYVNVEMASKQDNLVSGTNIKTINNESILGNGNIDVSGGDLSNYYTKSEVNTKLNGKLDITCIEYVANNSSMEIEDFDGNTIMFTPNNNGLEYNDSTSGYSKFLSDINYVDGLTGSLANLKTDNKTNLVSSINEVYEKSGEPFRVKQWGANNLNITVVPCTSDAANTSLAKMTFKIEGQEATDYQIVGMIAYEVFDAATGGNRINCWPVCQFTGQGQTELSVRWMCGGTTDKVAKRINAWVLLKHR